MSDYTRTAALLLAALVLGACAGDDPVTAPTTPGFRVEGAGHFSTDHFKIDEPVAFPIENPCNGEVVDIVGRDVGEINAVDTREHLDSGNSLHFEHHSHVTGTGTGELTGITYSFDDIFNEKFESPSVTAPQFTGSFTEVMHVASPVAGTSFTARFAVSVVLAPSADDLKVTRDLSSAQCGG
jgi:hypothetical protein